MLRFDDISFAVLGIIAAAIPLIIHLLFRRRFKTIHWAAVKLLREALESKRKTLRLRDILILTLRMTAVIAFGLMMARPHFRMTSITDLVVTIGLVALLIGVIGASIAWTTKSYTRPTSVMSAIGIALFIFVVVSIQFARQSDAGPTVFQSRQPVHAVLMIDNSRSMGVGSLGRSLLDLAKSKSIEFVERLPLDSRITVIPMAGSEAVVTLDSYRNKDDAIHSIVRIKLVDVPIDLIAAKEFAEQACVRTPSPGTKRVVILTDGQKSSWTNVTPATFAGLPDLQIVDVTKVQLSNVWISQFHLEDGLAGDDVPARFLARLHSTSLDQHRAGDTPFDVQVRLSIDGIDVATQSVAIIPGQERQIEFLHHFTTRADSMQPSTVIATIMVQADSSTLDSLPRDNQQQIVVPIVTDFPIVFIDQFGEQEDVDRNQIGETYALRQLVSPRNSSDATSHQLIQIHHLNPDATTQEQLQTARLVVVGGIEEPSPEFISLLRQYVVQGGPLVILAGGRFNPQAWTERAWLNGNGVLPAPLDPKPWGETPEESLSVIKPFFASFASMQHDFFQIENEDTRTLETLFNTTPFFKAVRCEVTRELLEQVLQADRARLSEEQSFLQSFEVRQRSNDAVNPISESDQQRYRALNPTWWNWRRPALKTNQGSTVDHIAELMQPHVLALFDDLQHPFVVERRIGAGRAIFVTSGVSSNWNLLRNSGAMYLFHRMFCRLMEQTLPRRNFVAGERIEITSEAHGGERQTLARPDGTVEPLSAFQHGDGSATLTIAHPLTAGIYSIATSSGSDDASRSPGVRPQTEQAVAVNGVEAESDLTVLSITELQSRVAPQVTVFDADQPIRLEGSRGAGRDLWKQLGYLLLGCLLLEKVILAQPWRRPQPA